MRISSSYIYICYYEDGKDAVGNYIDIFKSDNISVGDWYLDGNGELASRYTVYYPDGRTHKC